MLAASIFHFGEHTVAEAKAHMAAAGVTVRPLTQPGDRTVDFGELSADEGGRPRGRGHLVGAADQEVIGAARPTSMVVAVHPSVGLAGGVGRAELVVLGHDQQRRPGIGAGAGGQLVDRRAPAAEGRWRPSRRAIGRRPRADTSAPNDQPHSTRGRAGVRSAMACEGGHARRPLAAAVAVLALGPPTPRKLKRSGGDARAPGAGGTARR